MSLAPGALAAQVRATTAQTRIDAFVPPDFVLREDLEATVQRFYRADRRAAEERAELRADVTALQARPAAVQPAPNPAPNVNHGVPREILEVIERQQKAHDGLRRDFEEYKATSERRNAYYKKALGSVDKAFEDAATTAETSATTMRTAITTLNDLRAEVEVGRQSAVQNENKLEELEQTIAFNEVKNNEALRLVNEDVATYDDVDKLLSAASGPVQDRFELAERSFALLGTLVDLLHQQYRAVGSSGRSALEEVEEVKKKLLQSIRDQQKTSKAAVETQQTLSVEAVRQKERASIEAVEEKERLSCRMVNTSAIAQLYGLRFVKNIAQAALTAESAKGLAAIADASSSRLLAIQNAAGYFGDFVTSQADALREDLAQMKETQEDIFESQLERKLRERETAYAEQRDDLQSYADAVIDLAITREKAEFEKWRAAEYAATKDIKKQEKQGNTLERLYLRKLVLDHLNESSETVKTDRLAFEIRLEEIVEEVKRGVVGWIADATQLDRASVQAALDAGLARIRSYLAVVEEDIEAQTTRVTEQRYLVQVERGILETQRNVLSSFQNEQISAASAHSTQTESMKG